MASGVMIVYCWKLKEFTSCFEAVGKVFDFRLTSFSYYNGNNIKPYCLVGQLVTRYVIKGNPADLGLFFQGDGFKWVSKMQIFPGFYFNKDKCAPMT